MKLYTHIHSLLADTKTPVAIYLALRDKYWSPLLLESSDYNSRDGHYSYICLDPIGTISLQNNVLKIKTRLTVSKRDINKERINIPQILTQFKDSFEVARQEMPLCYAGIFGYSSFESVQLVEPDIKINSTKQVDIPVLIYSFYSLILAFNHITNTLIIISHHESESEASDRAIQIQNQIMYSISPAYGFEQSGDEKADVSENEFLEMAIAAKNHCKLGDVFQLVLSRRFRKAYKGDEFNVYRALKNINPSPYLFYFDLGDFRLFGSSPEAQLVSTNGKAEIHPIAGTYKRKGNAAEDLEKVNELLNDPKENAEHMMLVDLARNDLSKFCTKVNAEFLKQPQLYSHVIHLVSKIRGDIKVLNAPFDLLLGTFPAGTLSGAPKYNAIELISGYEPYAREFYGGCAGFIGNDNSINHAIMIRTFLAKNNCLYYQAGAGIVISSDETSELIEITNKLAALRKALDIAETFNRSENMNTKFKNDKNKTLAK
ncbi:MAG: trpE [Bacteroidetes bacterium]|nr:trpE [Bacteroidota bacterium]